MLWGLFLYMYIYVGECDCIRGFVPYPDDRGFPVCYQESLRGPCDDGKHLVSFADADDDELPESVNDFGTACVASNCTDNKVRKKIVQIHLSVWTA